MSIDDLGQPLGNAFAVAGGQARLYERGLSITGAVSAEVNFAFPRIGKPDIVTGNAPWQASAPVLRFDPHGTPVDPIAAAIFEAVGNRFALTAVGQATNRIIRSTRSGGASPRPVSTTSRSRSTTPSS